MQDVRLGMDRKRKQRVVGEIGTAWTIKNAHLTRGGDIDRRKSFVKQSGSFPSTTKGLYAINETLYTVGYSAAQAGNVPSGVTHVLTQHPTPSTVLVKSLDAKGYDGTLYSIAEFADGNIYHYYGANRVTDWDTLAATIGSNNALAAALADAIDNSSAVNASNAGPVITISSSVAGTPFTITQNTVNNGVNPDQTITLVQTQANVIATSEFLSKATVTITGGTANAGTNNVTAITVDGVDILAGPAEVVSTGSFTVTGGAFVPGVDKINSVTVNGVDILGAVVDHTGNNATTATAVTAQINSYISSPNYTAVAVGAVVTISALAGTGSSPNSFVVNPNVAGGFTVGGVNNMANGAYPGVAWVTSNSATATAIAARINSQTTSPDYTATAVGPVVTISALAGTGASPNGFIVNVTESGNVTEVHNGTMTGGVTGTSAVAQVYTATIGGTFEAADQFTITINGENYTITGGASGTGTSILTFKKKLYSTASANLYFCALNAPTQWISGLDYGFINMASQTAGQETLTAAEEYQGLMVIFSENNIRIWSISEDSSANVFIQTLQNTGTIAPRSVIPYGANDVFYLAASGVRSIKARDSSNAAYVSDVGTPIDTHIQEYMATLTQAEIQDAVGMVEPIDGRFWLALKNRIYVLSYFPSAKVSAWSYYEVGFTIKNFAKVGNKIYVRGTENGVDYLYLYGGLSNNTYPEVGQDACVVELPYFSANDPAGKKDLIGFDITAINSWDVDLLPDPSNDQVKVNLGIATGVTYGQPRFGVDSITPLFALTLTCDRAGSATLSALAMHYDGTFDSG